MAMMDGQTAWCQCGAERPAGLAARGVWVMQASHFVQNKATNRRTVTTQSQFGPIGPAGRGLQTCLLLHTVGFAGDMDKNFPGASKSQKRRQSVSFLLPLLLPSALSDIKAVEDVHVNEVLTGQIINLHYKAKRKKNTITSAALTEHKSFTWNKVKSSMMDKNIYMVQGEIGTVVGAIKRNSRWNTHTPLDEEQDPLLNSFGHLKEVLNNIKGKRAAIVAMQICLRWLETVKIPAKLAGG
ncbi:Golgi-specific brefeldin A-resistance guanine nucleotide exchange factor 1 [Collichthys lucidus]|uniref:Golgi-specific brefeldin A-resistance guanine nucleotide exchange factor 1 n=1 Tax=Collichthys lucidus TaxID=240159 RepID=A0A4U5VE75_COLLU|nr:Golgi-specific brefeldin A-resistance guanine nucleotide exchange factor 1 [Collichthys lucidus]